MKISWLATMVTLATTVLLGCGGTESDGIAPDGGRADATVPSEPFELEGSWTYLGPWDGEHILTTSSTTLKYTDVNGEWASNWTLKGYDNTLHHFQIVFDSGNGTYSPVGQDFSGTYVLNGAILTVQLTKGLESYPQVKSPDTCIGEDSNRIPDCRRYVKQY
jgi:hypothetical protein